MSRLAAIILLGLTAAAMVSSAARCDDGLKLAVGAPNNWDSGLPDIGKRAGIFKKHGLDLEILYTNGGGETLQAVISGSVDIGIGAGTGGVLGAFAKGAPVRNPARRYHRGRRPLLVRASGLAIEIVQGA